MYIYLYGLWHVVLPKSVFIHYRGTRRRRRRRRRRRLSIINQTIVAVVFFSFNPRSAMHRLYMWCRLLQCDLHIRKKCYCLYVSVCV